MSRIFLFIALTTLGLMFLLAPGFTQNPAKTPAASAEQIKRGDYLAKFGACHDCHTPKKFGPNGPELDLSKTLSGHPQNEKLPEFPSGVIGPDQWGVVGNNHFTAWAGPWGVSFSVNLTPDEETGMGTWTEEMFVKAMRTGKHMGEGRPILPPMPWPFIGQLTDEDLKAIYAYLRSIPPIQNAVPDPIPPTEK